MQGLRAPPPGKFKRKQFKIRQNARAAGVMAGTAGLVVWPKDRHEPATYLYPEDLADSVAINAQLDD